MLGNPFRSVYNELPGLKNKAWNIRVKRRLTVASEHMQDEFLKNESISSSWFVTDVSSKIQNYQPLSHRPEFNKHKTLIKAEVTIFKFFISDTKKIGVSLK